jgi:lysophospholipase L1-like esterase
MIKKYILFGFSFFLFAFSFPEKKKITIWMCGDSTMSIKEKKAYPETGWGMPFVFFWDSTVTIENRAKNGRSTKTFISEKLWQNVIDNVKEGDYVFIQFGHNDEAKEKVERYTTPEEYKTNVKKFISETRNKKGIPVLFTPVSRRRFDADGHAIETHKDYSALVREIASSEKVNMIDLDRKTIELYEQFGKENSRWLFLQLKPGEHPSYPGGRDDNTHINELGARLVAQLALSELKHFFPALADRVIQPVVK